MASITITLTDIGEAQIKVTTDADHPVVGRPVTPAEALAMELLGTSFRRGAEVFYDANQVPLVALALDLMSPEMYGWAVPQEIRRRVRLVLGPRMGQLVPQQRTPSAGVDIDAVHRRASSRSTEA